MPQHAVIGRIVRPLEAFFRAEGAGGVSVMLAAVVALVWANSRWFES